jgi:RHS repeat-associated protein
LAPLSSLHNGNIGAWTWGSRTAAGGKENLASRYRYDVLNRIRVDTLSTRASNAWTATPNYRSSYTYDGNGNIKSLVRVDSAGTLMDSLIYRYQTNKNRLTHVDDPGGVASNHSFDVDDQATNNYTYDATGNLTSDAQEGITNIEWTPSNKIRSITKGTNSKLEYTYDAMGNRVVKRYYQPANTLKSTTWYVRDAQGNVLSVYERESPTSEVKQTEAHIYGSSRIGIEQRSITYSTSPFAWIGAEQHRDAGTKRYELTDHLGNVRAVISDLLVDRPTGFGYATQDVEVIDRRDYYPFGMEMPGRRWRVTGEGAGRFGYNGKENDNEVKGEGNQQDYGFRIYDPRVARFLSVDPLARDYPWNSTYAFAEGDAIRSIDLEGRERSIVIYDFSSDKITKTKIDLQEAGPLGNGALVKSNHGGQIAYYYGSDIVDGNITSFKKAYEGVVQDKQGNHVGYLDSKGFPTIGYGHLVKKGEPYKVGSTITEDAAQEIFKTDSKSIFAQADKHLEGFELSDSQREALYDASFNMGPGKMRQYQEGEGKFSGEFFFLQFMAGGEGIKKRRYAENILYSQGLYLHLDHIKNGRLKETAEQVVDDATAPAPSTPALTTPAPTTPD